LLDQGQSAAFRLTWDAMSTEPLVSVIIPACRAEATLPVAVRSLLAQTCPSWQEIIASDDEVDHLTVLARAGIRDDRRPHFLEITENGRAPRVEVELVRLLEESCRAG
jgi:hypothetical protein